nr:hypothetical protein [Tanacetum cinerariifolium]
MVMFPHLLEHSEPEPGFARPTIEFEANNRLKSILGSTCQLVHMCNVRLLIMGAREKRSESLAKKRSRLSTASKPSIAA